MIARASQALRPFFSYYGGKHRSVSTYPEPRYGRIVEPFAGSAAYATRYHTADVLLVDTNPKVCGVWRYLIATPAAEIRALPLLGDNDTLVDLGGVPEEARWLVGFWLGKAMARPARTPSPWMKSGRWPGSFWGERVRARLAWQVERIRHWRVRECSYELVQDQVATWFVDPPYQGKGHHYNGPLPDFEHLAAWCRERSGQVVVCENEGATWLPFRPHALAKTLNRRDGWRGYSREAIWTNAPAAQGVLCL